MAMAYYADRSASMDVLDELSLYASGGSTFMLPFMTRFGAMASDHSGPLASAPSQATGAPGAEDEARRLYGHAIAFLLTQLVRANALTSADEETVETFSCPPNKTPSITIHDYVQRIMKYTPGTKELYLASLVYVDRVLKYNPGMRLTIRNVHRLYMISVVVASKFLDDLFYTNKYFASVAGLGTPELNALEVALLVNTRFELSISPEEFEAYHAPAERLSRLAQAHGDLSTFFREAEYRRRALAHHHHQQQLLLQAQAQAQAQAAAQVQQASQIAQFISGIRLPRASPPPPARMSAPVIVSRSPVPMEVAASIAPLAPLASQQPQQQQKEQMPQVSEVAASASSSLASMQGGAVPSSCDSIPVATASNMGSPSAAAATNRKRTLSCSKPGDLRRFVF
eukprot:m51a1_g14675 hypothetical protein (398) ;mRNA; r:48819-50655